MIRSFISNVQSTYIISLSEFSLPFTIFCRRPNVVSFFIISSSFSLSLWKARRPVSLVSNLLSLFPWKRMPRMARIKDTTCKLHPPFSFAPPIFPSNDKKSPRLFIANLPPRISSLYPIFCNSPSNFFLPSPLFYIIFTHPGPPSFIQNDYRMQEHFKSSSRNIVSPDDKGKIDLAEICRISCQISLLLHGKERQKRL